MKTPDAAKPESASPVREPNSALSNREARRGARRRRRRLWQLPLLLLSMGAAPGCSQQPTAIQFRSLGPSEAVSFLCLAQDPTLRDGVYDIPRPVNDCPNRNFDADDDVRRLHAMVTQQETGEVALVDLAANRVVDVEPSQPGYNFFAVGAEPRSIASTPGSMATFVAVAEPGREGIFTLPTNCLGRRRTSETIRDITSWPACRLPSAPSRIEVLIDPPQRASDGELQVRNTCGGDYEPVTLAPGDAVACGQVDLALETRTPGRRKLLVMMPEHDEQLAVIDAQSLLDLEAGSFGDCPIEYGFTLSPALVGAEQVQSLPNDYAEDECRPEPFSRPPSVAASQTRPSDLALADGRVYLSDFDAPKIHVLDASDPCQIEELPSLQPQAFLDPGALVTTRKLAVSPRTNAGQRFVYAVDANAVSGSLMVFDVSDGSENRTPLLLERSSFNPSLPPDRIRFPQEVADIEFGYQDLPAANLTTGVAIDGIECDPLPSVPPASPAAQYRPRTDYSAGASPSKLRGVFGFATLHSGRVSVIDVEDLDAQCRRPRAGNQESDPDFRGCSDDPVASFETRSGNTALRTTSGEVSCHVVQPHRPRSGTFFINDRSYGRAAALRSFPRLISETGRSLATDQSDEGRLSPKLLAVPPSTPGGDKASVFIGSTEYTLGGGENELVVAPESAERSSLLLTFEEPRAFVGSERFTATYEGVLRNESEGFLEVDEGQGVVVLRDDANARICASGIQDADVTAARATELLDSESAIARFVREQTDYVEITGDFPEDDSDYWAGPGAQCGEELRDDGVAAGPRVGQLTCQRFFGPSDAPTTARELRIRRAWADRLELEPRDYDPVRDQASRRDIALDLVACCFPQAISYVVRAGGQWLVRGDATGVANSMTSDATGRCVEDCSSYRSRQRSRVFEISCGADCPVSDEDGEPIIGLAGPDDQLCVVDDPRGGVDPNEVGEECIFQSLTTRFAVYRGLEPTVKDMSFFWRVQGGFSPLSVNLSLIERTPSSPTAITFIPQTGEFAVADGGSKGLVFVPMRSLADAYTIF